MSGEERKNLREAIDAFESAADVLMRAWLALRDMQDFTNARLASADTILDLRRAANSLDNYLEGNDAE